MFLFQSYISLIQIYYIYANPRYGTKFQSYISLIQIIKFPLRCCCCRFQSYISLIQICIILRRLMLVRIFQSYISLIQILKSSLIGCVILNFNPILVLFRYSTADVNAVTDTKFQSYISLIQM